MEKLTLEKMETIVGGQADCEAIWELIWTASTPEGQQAAIDAMIRVCND